MNSVQNRAIERGRRVWSDIKGYSGPKDALSHIKHEWFTRPLDKALVDFMVRVEVEGAENMPHTGKYLYCPTHPTTTDPMIIPLLTPRPLRYMAARDAFEGFKGQIMAWGGAFPINRHHPNFVTLEHSMDVLKAGEGLCVFPEGRCSKEHHEQQQVGALRTGAAHLALRMGTDIVPVSVVYQPSEIPIGERRIRSAASAGAFAAVTAAASAVGAPLTAALAVAGGALAGCYAAGKWAFDHSTGTTPVHTMPRYFSTLAANLGGGAAGALIAGLALPLGPAVVAGCAIAGTVGCYGLAQSWLGRDRARVSIGEPIEVEPFRNQPIREAKIKLTEHLHETLGRLKEAQIGIPYDDKAPKVLAKLEPWM